MYDIIILTEKKRAKRNFLGREYKAKLLSSFLLLLFVVPQLFFFEGIMTLQDLVACGL